MITYLWKNREIAPLLSKRFFKIWAKRAFHLKSLIAIGLNRYMLLIRGARIDSSSIIHGFNLVGKASNLTIGSNTFITKTIHMACHEKITIGNNVVINDNVQLLTATHDLADKAWPMVRKPIVIGDYAWIATSAIILPGVTIGEGAVVGAGAVISKDVPAYKIAFGNPGQLSIKSRCMDLSYNPVIAVACFEAWLGKK